MSLSLASNRASAGPASDRTLLRLDHQRRKRHFRRRENQTAFPCQAPPARQLHLMYVVSPRRSAHRRRSQTKLTPRKLGPFSTNLIMTLDTARLANTHEILSVQRELQQMNSSADDFGDGESSDGWAENERIPTFCFNRTFTHIPEHVRQDLETLERESVIYTDHWIKEIGDFRHVKISLTTEECNEFARRSWAYELFLRAEPMWAADVPEIDRDIARDADTYVMMHEDGTKIGPPYHCFAAFLGKELEALSCFDTERRTVISLEGRDFFLFEVKHAIKSLTATIRSFNRRERGLSPWTITCEDDVRDLLYVMLRPRIFDIRKEEPVPAKAGTYKFVDLCSKSIPFLIEVKWISRKGTWKRKVDEIYVDIQTYARHPASQTIFFVIVDDVRDIQDPRLLEQELTATQMVDDKEISIVLLVCDG